LKIIFVTAEAVKFGEFASVGFEKMDAVCGEYVRRVGDRIKARKSAALLTDN
jgi:hypothetical protein